MKTINKYSSSIAYLLLIMLVLAFTACTTDTKKPNQEIPSNMIYVSGGTFDMGSETGDNDELPVHPISLTNFYIAKHETTQGEWEEIMGYNPASDSGFGEGNQYPVFFVSWYDIMVYCNKKSVKEGLTPCYTKDGEANTELWGNVPTAEDSIQWDNIICDWSANGYRLPTEAEWEYAARGGRSSQHYTYSGSNIMNEVAWNANNSMSKAHLVGTKANNELGIYDMSGNVYEWVWDWYGPYSASNSQINPSGPETGLYHVGRGGAWFGSVKGCKTTYRNYFSPSGKNKRFGFRVARKA